VSAGVLIDALWPDSEGDAAYHALESALYRLRQLLGARDAVRMEGGKVSLNRDQLWVDMWKFEEELQRPHDPEANRIERIGRLRRLYQGHFLQHEAERPWVLRARQELRDGLLRAIREVAGGNVFFSPPVAKRLLKQWRGTQRYLPIQRMDEDALTRTITTLASEDGRCGYRRITALLRMTVSCQGSTGHWG